MKQLLIDGQLCTFFLERASDGGMIVNAVSPDAASGVYVNYRHWYQDPEMARKEYAELDEVGARSRVDMARRFGITGRLHGLDA